MPGIVNPQLLYYLPGPTPSAFLHYFILNAMLHHKCSDIKVHLVDLYPEHREVSQHSHDCTACGREKIRAKKIKLLSSAS